MKKKIGKYKMKKSATVVAKLVKAAQPVTLSTEFANVPQWLEVASHTSRLLIQEGYEDCQIAFRLASKKELAKSGPELKGGYNIVFESGSTFFLEFVYLDKELNWYPFDDTTPESFANYFVMGLLCLCVNGDISDFMESVYARVNLAK